jgi:DNA-binding XRE family transcriptional regulator
VTEAKTTRRRKGFDELRKQIDADPARRARVEEHKVAMLGELRRKLDLTQVAVADRLEVTQENVSHIERGDDLRLSTLGRYVAALGGRLELRAAFPGETVTLNVGGARSSRASTRVGAARASATRGSRAASKAARHRQGQRGPERSPHS